MTNHADAASGPERIAEIRARHEGHQKALGDLGSCTLCEVLSALAAAEQRAQAAMQTIAGCLSPENQNVINGDLVGSVRDMAQVYVTSKDNAREAMSQWEAAEAHKNIVQQERDGQARAAQREFVRANKAEAAAETLRAERDAMQRRAEAAESDWQDAEAERDTIRAENAKLREAADHFRFCRSCAEDGPSSCYEGTMYEAALASAPEAPKG